MKQLVIMNFLMLIFVTVSQDAVKQGLDLISADYEKKAGKSSEEIKEYCDCARFSDE